jgi:hypothetical protein
MVSNAMCEGSNETHLVMVLGRGLEVCMGIEGGVLLSHQMIDSLCKELLGLLLESLHTMALTSVT